MTREEALKGLECCADFECGECPYKIYSHIDYKFRCNYKLISDLKEIMPKAGTWKDYSSTMMECSVCQRHVPYHRYEFCPHCGTKMTKEN
jgi:hypothetical protein